MKLLMHKSLGSLRPVDDAGQEALQKIANNATVMIEIKQPRNIRHHRLYFALINIVWQNQERYPDTYTLHSAIKIAAGIRTEIVMPNGATVYIPGSIAFHEMDDLAFRAFYDKVCDIVCKHFLPGISNEDLRREVETMVGVRAA